MDQPIRPPRSEQGKRPRPSQLDEEADAYLPLSKKLRHSSDNLKATLDYHTPDIIELIDLITLIPYLIRHNLLTQHEQQLLQNRTLTEEVRKSELVSLIGKKAEGRHKFLEALSEEPQHSGHRKLYEILTDLSKIVPATTQQSSPPLGATSLQLSTADFDPPTPPRGADDRLQDSVSTPCADLNPVYIPITPPEEEARSPSPPILNRPKSIKEMDKMEEILKGFFMSQIHYKCNEHHRDQLGIILLGQELYYIVRTQASLKGKTVVERMFYEWISRRGRDADWRELADAFKKMGHKNLYHRLHLYIKQYGRLYSTA